MDCCGHEGHGSGDARFEIKKVADGVHVAVAAPAYKVNSNTAIIESDDGVIIVDTHSKPSAARVIVERLRDLTPKPVRYVVNTHFHWDHWHGNEVYPAAYPDAEIVTNQITREAMRTKGLKRIQDHVRQVPAEVAKLEAALAKATDADRPKIARDLALARSYLAEVSALEPALPTIAFENTMRLYRRDREIQLLHLGRAHTEGDVFVYLPKEKVVITGDAMIGWTPFMGDGYPEEWVGTLDRLAQLDFTHIIMGHGDVAGREWLATAPVSPAARREITVQLAVIAALEAQITGYDPEVKRIAKHPDAQRLQTIPGIGIFGAALLLAEIGTIQRFHTAHELAAYAGLVPSTRSSGDKTSHGGVSRESNHWLKWILIEAVQTLKQVPGPVRFHYERLLRAKGKPKATVAAARKLCTYIYWMWAQDLSYAAWLEAETKRVGCPRQTLASSA